MKEKDANVFLKRPDSSGRRGFLKNAGLATMTALAGMALPLNRQMPAKFIPAAFANQDVLDGEDGVIHLNGASAMALTLKPFGLMKVFPGKSLQHPGPLATRLTARIDRVEWDNKLMGDVSAEYGMGSYLQGPAAGHVTVRLALKTGDDVPFYFEYISRGDMEKHLTGEAPIFLAGQIEIDPENEKYAWLNHAQIIGQGMLTRDPVCQTYEMAILGG